MTNFLQDGMAWLGGQLQTHTGRTVGIRQGRQTVTDLVATVASKKYQVLNSEQFLTEVAFYDWTFVKADLDAAGIVLRGGAIVFETLNGELREYTAVPVGDQPEVEDADTSGILVRLHTQRMK